MESRDHSITRSSDTHCPPVVIRQAWVLMEVFSAQAPVSVDFC